MTEDLSYINNEVSSKDILDLTDNILQARYGEGQNTSSAPSLTGLNPYSEIGGNVLSPTQSYNSFYNPYSALRGLYGRDLQTGEIIDTRTLTGGEPNSLQGKLSNVKNKELSTGLESGYVDTRYGNIKFALGNDDLEQTLFDSQGWLEQVGNTLVEIGGVTASRGISLVGDFIQSILVSGVNDINKQLYAEAFGNIFPFIGKPSEIARAKELGLVNDVYEKSIPIQHRLAKQLDDSTRNNFPIYKDPNASGFDFGSRAWWLNGTVDSIASIASMVGQVALAIGTRGASLPAQVAALFGGAMIGRYNENMMESIETAKRSYEEMYNLFGNKDNYETALNSEEGKEFLKSGKIPTRANLANHYAMLAGSKSFDWNWTNFAFDVIQSIPMFGMVGKFGGTPFKIAAANIIQKGGKVGFATYATQVGSIGVSIASEGVEEMINGISQLEGMHYGKYLAGLEKNVEWYKRVNEYLGEEEVWEQGFWGMIGGGIFEGTGRIVGSKNQRKENDARLAEIATRFDRMTFAKKEIDLINNGISPVAYSSLSNEEKKKIDLKDASTIPTNITFAGLGVTEEDVAEIQANAQEDFINRVSSYLYNGVVGTDGSRATNNTKLLINNLKDANFRQQLVEQGIASSETVDKIANQIVDNLKERDKLGTRLFNSIDRLRGNNPINQILVGKALNVKDKIDQTKRDINRSTSRTSKLKNEDISYQAEVKKTEGRSIDELIEIQAAYLLQKNLKKKYDTDKKAGKEVGNVEDYTLSIEQILGRTATLNQEEQQRVASINQDIVWEVYENLWNNKTLDNLNKIYQDITTNKATQQKVEDTLRNDAKNREEGIKKAFKTVYDKLNAEDLSRFETEEEAKSYIIAELNKIENGAFVKNSHALTAKRKLDNKIESIFKNKKVKQTVKEDTTTVEVEEEPLTIRQEVEKAYEDLEEDDKIKAILNNLQDKGKESRISEDGKDIREYAAKYKMEETLYLIELIANRIGKDTTKATLDITFKEILRGIATLDNGIDIAKSAMKGMLPNLYIVLKQNGNINSKETQEDIFKYNIDEILAEEIVPISLPIADVRPATDTATGVFIAPAPIEGDKHINTKRNTEGNIETSKQDAERYAQLSDIPVGTDVEVYVDETHARTKKHIEDDTLTVGNVVIRASVSRNGVNSDILFVNEVEGNMLFSGGIGYSSEPTDNWMYTVVNGSTKLGEETERNLKLYSELDEFFKHIRRYDNSTTPRGIQAILNEYNKYSKVKLTALHLQLLDTIFAHNTKTPLVTYDAKENKLYSISTEKYNYVRAAIHFANQFEYSKSRQGTKLQQLAEALDGWNVRQTIDVANTIAIRNIVWNMYNNPATKGTILKTKIVKSTTGTLIEAIDENGDNIFHKLDDSIIGEYEIAYVDKVNNFKVITGVREEGIVQSTHILKTESTTGSVVVLIKTAQGTIPFHTSRNSLDLSKTEDVTAEDKAMVEEERATIDKILAAYEINDDEKWAQEELNKIISCKKDGKSVVLYIDKFNTSEKKGEQEEYTQIRIWVNKSTGELHIKLDGSKTGKDSKLINRTKELRNKALGKAHRSIDFDKFNNAEYVNNLIKRGILVANIGQMGYMENGKFVGVTNFTINNTNNGSAGKANMIIQIDANMNMSTTEEVKAEPKKRGKKTKEPKEATPKKSTRKKKEEEVVRTVDEIKGELIEELNKVEQRPRLDKDGKQLLDKKGKPIVDEFIGTNGTKAAELVQQLFIALVRDNNYTQVQLIEELLTILSNETRLSISDIKPYLELLANNPNIKVEVTTLMDNSFAKFVPGMNIILLNPNTFGAADAQMQVIHEMLHSFIDNLTGQQLAVLKDKSLTFIEDLLSLVVVDGVVSREKIKEIMMKSTNFSTALNIDEKFIDRVYEALTILQNEDKWDELFTYGLTSRTFATFLSAITEEGEAGTTRWQRFKEMIIELIDAVIGKKSKHDEMLDILDSIFKTPDNKTNIETDTQTSLLDDTVIEDEIDLDEFDIQESLIAEPYKIDIEFGQPLELIEDLQDDKIESINNKVLYSTKNVENSLNSIYKTLGNNAKSYLAAFNIYSKEALLDDFNKSGLTLEEYNTSLINIIKNCL